jgi:2-polyprenyl-3-methyl-5-hydroxy-6-metoxy-1,4-benzoquinol methylase
LSNSYYSLCRPEILSHIKQLPVNVLDVGCGAGFFGESLIEKYACTVYGVELNTQAAQCAEKRLPHIINASIDDALPLLQDNFFDTIFLNDVLEHLYDPAKTLCQIKRKLHSDGLVYASIPSIIHYQELLNLLLRKDFVYEEAGIMDFTHIRWFTKKGMKRLFHDAGLTVVAQHGINPTPSRLQRLISFCSVGFYEETKYPQFLTIGKK